MATTGLFLVLLEHDRKAREEVANRLGTAVLGRASKKGYTQGIPFLGSIEYLYALVLGFVQVQALTDPLREVLDAEIRYYRDNNWFDPYRFAFSAGAQLILSDFSSHACNIMVKYLASLGLDQLKMDELIPVLWLVTKNFDRISDALRKEDEASLVEALADCKQKLWDLFHASQAGLVFAYPPTDRTTESEELTGEAGYFIPTLQLALLDDVLADFQQRLLVFSKTEFDEKLVRTTKRLEIWNLLVSAVACLSISLFLVHWVSFVPSRILVTVLVLLNADIFLLIVARLMEVLQVRVPLLPSTRSLLEGNTREWVKFILVGAVAGLLSYVTTPTRP